MGEKGDTDFLKEELECEFCGTRDIYCITCFPNGNYLVQCMACKRVYVQVNDMIGFKIVPKGEKK